MLSSVRRLSQSTTITSSCSSSSSSPPSNAGAAFTAVVVPDSGNASTAAGAGGRTSAGSGVATTTIHLADIRAARGGATSADDGVAPGSPPPRRGWRRNDMVIRVDEEQGHVGHQGHHGDVPQSAPPARVSYLPERDLLPTPRAAAVPRSINTSLRRCAACLISWPIQSFSRSQLRRHGRRARCKACVEAKAEVFVPADTHHIDSSNPNEPDFHVDIARKRAELGPMLFGGAGSEDADAVFSLAEALAAFRAARTAPAETPWVNTGWVPAPPPMPPAPDNDNGVAGEEEAGSGSGSGSGSADGSQEERGMPLSRLAHQAYQVVGMPAPGGTPEDAAAQGRRVPITPLPNYYYGIPELEYGGSRFAQMLPDTGAGVTAGVGDPDADDVSTEPGDTDIRSLPPELLLNIFSHLDTDDLRNCFLVCHTWRLWLLDDYLWQGVYDTEAYRLAAIDLRGLGGNTFLERQPNQPAYQHILTAFHHAKRLRFEAAQREELNRRMAEMRQLEQTRQQNARRTRQKIEGTMMVLTANAFLLSVLITLGVMLPLKLDGYLDQANWFVVFLPFFVGLGLVWCFGSIGVLVQEYGEENIVPVCLFPLVCAVVLSPLWMILLKVEDVIPGSWAFSLIPAYIVTAIIPIMFLHLIGPVMEDVYDSYASCFEGLFHIFFAVFLFGHLAAHVAGWALLTLALDGRLADDTSWWQIFSPELVLCGFYFLSMCLNVIYLTGDGDNAMPFEGMVIIGGGAFLATTQLVLVLCYLEGLIGSFFLVMIPVYVITIPIFCAANVVVWEERP